MLKPVKVSVKLPVVKAMLFGLVTVNVMAEVLPTPMVLGLNALVMVGFVTNCRVAVLDAGPRVVWVEARPLVVLL